jgi:tetratricopeptide (TPR) repeat protein
MPMTEFARMKRSDHSLRPPAPAATIEFGSPNACNICHMDKDAEWADKYVREWRKRDYQKPIIVVGRLIKEARKQDWKNLDMMLGTITNPDNDEIFITSLIRLLSPCNDTKKEKTLIEAMKNPSPLVRSAAIEGLTFIPLSQPILQALIVATADDYRLVRVQAGSALSLFPLEQIKSMATKEERETISKAVDEYLHSNLCRPDQWSSHYNIGNFHMNQNDLDQALASYETALKIEPTAVMALVNSSIAYARTGKNDLSEKYLQVALNVNPTNAAANFNMGLLKAEKNDLANAEAHLRAALKEDPTMHEAAYNLAVLVAQNNPGEAIQLCSKAYEISPTPKYGYTAAFYLWQNKELELAAEMLRNVTNRWPSYVDAVLLLSDIYTQLKKTDQAVEVLQKTLQVPNLSQQDQYRIVGKLRGMTGN